MSHGHLEGGAPRHWLVVTAAVTAGLLALLVPRQIFDTNFYSLWEATNLLAGDHPYRDFFEWGIPLQAAISAAAQWIVGYRMAGEFVLVHWPFIIAGAVISFDLGYRLTGSVAATAITALLALAVLPDTPTFHYPKLFLYPAAIWLTWRYLERPAIRWAAGLGLLTAAAFLFRHDHGVYIGVAAVLACVLARCTGERRPWRRTMEETAAYTIVAAVVLLPWVIVVQRAEGLPEYVRSRSDLYQMWSASKNATRAILSRNPLEFAKERWSPRPPRAGTVSFSWAEHVDERGRAQFEQRFGLRRIDGPDPDQRFNYHVDNIYAAHLYDLKELTADTRGLDWELLQALNEWLPRLEPSRLWLAQITVVIPLLLLGVAALHLSRNLYDRSRPSLETVCLLLTGLVLTLIGSRLFREVSYAHLVAPLTAAMGARFLTIPRAASVLDRARITIAAVLAAATAVTATVCMQPRAVFSAGNATQVAREFRRMLQSPPIDAFATRAEVQQWTAGYDLEAWTRNAVPQWPEILLRYMHDCTADGDRVLITGQTPFQVGYLIERPVAGGHLFWHHQWRSDPARETELLALLQRQSVPFAFSASDPVLTDLRFYPHVRAYFEANYTEIAGSRRLLLVDRRRRPTGTFGPYRFPCFK